MAARIRNRMGVAYSACKAPCKDGDSAYIYEQATKDAYEECGVEWYEFLATLDGKTSEICRELDGTLRRSGTPCRGRTTADAPELPQHYGRSGSRGKRRKRKRPAGSRRTGRGNIMKSRRYDLQAVVWYICGRKRRGWVEKSKEGIRISS